MILARILFALIRRDNVPSRMEVSYCLKRRPLARVTRIYQAMADYANGRAIEDIAKEMVVTRTRVKMMLAEGCRRVYEVKK
jgi:hypothetical protein